MVAPITIGVMTAEMTDHREKIDIVTTAGSLAETDQGPQHVEPTMMIVAHPGLRLPRGSMMIEGLQGTMITDAAVMMTADHHLIIMNVAGMIMIVVGMTDAATIRMNFTRKGPPGKTAKVDGPDRWW